MQIVINISEEQLDMVKHSHRAIFADVYSMMAKVIMKGKPLPKGHGRIMDVDKILKKMEEREDKLKDDRSMWEIACVETALDMFGETIIEADTESEDKE